MTNDEQVVEVQWEPISTAPRDGTVILLLHEDGTERLAKWDNRKSGNEWRYEHPLVGVEGSKDGLFSGWKHLHPANNVSRVIENTEYQKMAWVIITNREGFETCVHETLIRSGSFWFNHIQLWRPNGDVFNTELAARNELEKRLYERSENLRKYREEMSRALVNCAPPIGKSKTVAGGE